MELEISRRGEDGARYDARSGVGYFLVVKAAAECGDGAPIVAVPPNEHRGI